VQFYLFDGLEHPPSESVVKQENRSVGDNNPGRNIPSIRLDRPFSQTLHIHNRIYLHKTVALVTLTD